MIANQKPAPNAIILDNTALEKFACPQAFNLYVYERRQAAEDSAPLAAGNAIHLAMAARYKHENYNDIAVVEPLMLDALRNGWSGIDPDDWRTLPLAENFIREYNKYYPIETFTPIAEQVETPFLIQLGTCCGIEIWWTGIIDLKLYNGPGNTEGTWIMDHKTASRYGGTYFDQFALASAQTGYAFASWKLTGDKPRGYEINALVWRAPTKTGTGFEFGRRRFFLQDWHYDQWLRDVLRKVETIIHYRNEGYFPRETHQCGKWLGFSPCPYIHVCTADPDQRAGNLRSALYKDVTWNPAKNLGGTIR